MLFRFGGRDVHMPRLIGAFILFSALLFFFQSSAQMFSSWDSIKEVNSCLSNPGFPREVCQNIADKALGIYVNTAQEQLSLRQFFSIILGPIGMLMFWLAVLFLGMLAYKTGQIVVPIEESIKIFDEKKENK